MPVYAGNIPHSQEGLSSRPSLYISPPPADTVPTAGVYPTVDYTNTSSQCFTLAHGPGNYAPYMDDINSKPYGTGVERTYHQIGLPQVMVTTGTTSFVSTVS